jgi:hypothetical protein
MKKLVALIVFGIVLGACALPSYAVPGNMTRAQSRANRKAIKKQQKAMKKYQKAQRKAQNRMIKKDRKNTHYPGHRS